MRVAATWGLAGALTPPRMLDPGPNLVPGYVLAAALPRGLHETTIVSGQAVSGDVDLASGTLVGIVMPEAWTAAGLTFQVSVDGSTWSELFDAAGNAISYTVAAGRASSALRRLGRRAVRAPALRNIGEPGSTRPPPARSAW